MNYELKMNRRLKIIKLLIVIKYLYELKKAPRLPEGTAFGFEAFKNTDSIGNITAITDKDGNIVERYKYNIYGSPTITDNTGNPINESAIGNDYLFQSRRYDKELHLYYYRARTYDPEIGRFLQTDPIGYKDSMNLYQAMNMNPWSFVDPWGLLEYKWNFLGVFRWNEKEKLKKIINGKKIIYYINGNESQAPLLRRGLLVHDLDANYDTETKKYKPNFIVIYQPFIYLVKRHSSIKHLNHEKTHILGYKLMLLEELFLLKRVEEKSKGFDTYEECLKSMVKTLKKISPLYLALNRKKTPYYNYLFEKNIAKFANPLSRILGVLYGSKATHVSGWKNFAEKFDMEKINYALENFDKFYKKYRIFKLDYFYKEKNKKANYMNYHSSAEIIENNF